MYNKTFKVCVSLIDDVIRVIIFISVAMYVYVESLSDCKSLSIDALEQITITKRHSASRLDLIKSHIHNLQHGDRINVFLESILKGLPVSANNVKNNSNFAPSNSTVSQLLSSMSSSSSSSSSSSRLSK